MREEYIMREKWDAFMGRSGFFVTMAVCLVVAGISGYFLLFDREEKAPKEEPLVMADEVPAPVEKIPAKTEEPVKEPVPAVEVLAPEPVEEVTSMPEIPVDPTPVKVEKPQPMTAPLTGEVVTAFSMDTLVFNETLEDWRIHDGIDISAPEGTPVLSACAGTVLSVENDALMGTTVTVSHPDGYETTYANLKEGPPVAAGDKVSGGEVIGTVGTTAAVEAAQPPHLHFSVKQNGKVTNPHDFLNQ
jgi:murein DD-endopeptidase MepM/ murein hydrolase activator NlpD